MTIHAVRKTSLPKPLKTLLLSVDVSDLAVGVLVQPLYVAGLVMEITQNADYNPTYDITYKAFHFTLRFFSFASFFGVSALSADRFLAIYLHLRYQELVTHKRVVAVVISMWVLSAFLALFALFIQKITFLVAAVVTVFCLISTTYFYVEIYLVVRRHAHQIQRLQLAGNDDMTDATRQRKKYALGTFYAYLVFLVCYLPQICTFVANISTGRSTLIKHLYMYTYTLLLLNSSLNPLIYCWKMRHIRHAIIAILRNILY